MCRSSVNARTGEEIEQRPPTWPPRHSKQGDRVNESSVSLLLLNRFALPVPLVALTAPQITCPCNHLPGPACLPLLPLTALPKLSC